MDRSLDEDLSGSVDRERDAVVPDAPPPALESVVEKINPRTRALLAELFKAEVKAVRRITRDKLR